MSMFAKIMVIVNFLLAVLFLGAAGTLLGAAEDYKRKYEAAQEAAEDTNRASNETIARLTQDKDTAEKSLAAASEQEKKNADTIDMLNTTLARYKAEKGQLTGGITMDKVDGVVQACDN